MKICYDILEWCAVWWYTVEFTTIANGVTMCNVTAWLVLSPVSLQHMDCSMSKHWLTYGEASWEDCLLVFLPQTHSVKLCRKYIHTIRLLLPAFCNSFRAVNDGNMPKMMLEGGSSGVVVIWSVSYTFLHTMCCILLGLTLIYGRHLPVWTLSCKPYILHLFK